MSKGNVIFRESAGITCPSCGENLLYYLWTFKVGTTKSSIEAWDHEQKQAHCIELKEYCTSCNYNNLR